MKNVLTWLAKSVLISLGLLAAESTTDEAIPKKIYGSGMTPLRISKEEMKNVMEIVIYFEESSLLNKLLAKQLKMMQNNKKVELSAC